MIKQVVKGVEDIFKEIGLQHLNGWYVTERERKHFVQFAHLIANLGKGTLTLNQSRKGKYGEGFDNWKKSQDKMKEHEKTKLTKLRYVQWKDQTYQLHRR